MAPFRQTCQTVTMISLRRSRWICFLNSSSASLYRDLPLRLKSLFIFSSFRCDHCGGPQSVLLPCNCQDLLDEVHLKDSKVQKSKKKSHSAAPRKKCDSKKEEASASTRNAANAEEATQQTTIQTNQNTKQVPPDETNRVT